MYTRSYFPDEERISIPENYDGNAFSSESAESGIPSVQPAMAEPKISPRDTPPVYEEETAAPAPAEESVPASSEGLFSSVLSRFSLKKLLPDKLGNFLKLDSLKLGTEELLLIGLALFLFFSKDGDKECALILLLLIFVN